MFMLYFRCIHVIEEAALSDSETLIFTIQSTGAGAGMDRSHEPYQMFTTRGACLSYDMV